MKNSLLAFAASLALLTSPAMAETNLGVVNIGKIMQESKAAVSVRSQIQAKQKSFQSDLDSKEKELVAENQALAKAKDTTDKEAFGKKVKEFNEKASAAQRQVQGRKAQLEKSVSGAQEEILKAAAEIVKAIATEKKLTLVVSNTQVLYGDPSLDLTDEVMKRLDAKLPNVTVKF